MDENKKNKKEIKIQLSVYNKYSLMKREKKTIVNIQYVLINEYRK